MIAPVVLALTVGFLGWAYQALKPPPPKICGSPVGPPVTSPRVKLNDGRYLAYREFGVPKEEAKHKIVIIHGFDSSKDLHLPISRVCFYIVSFFGGHSFYIVDASLVTIFSRIVQNYCNTELICWIAVIRAVICF